MNSEELLLKIKEIYGDGAFTSNCLASILDKPRKEISNGLRRLYKMDYLSRKRADRKCRDKRKVPYNRGYCYEYQLNKKGKERIEWLTSKKRLESGFRLKSISPDGSEFPYKQIKNLDQGISLKMIDDPDKSTIQNNPKDTNVMLLSHRNCQICTFIRLGKMKVFEIKMRYSNPKWSLLMKR